jgi:glutamine synthetase
MNINDAQSFLHDGGFEYVRFEQTDLHGLTRAKTVPEPHFRRFTENGLNFFGGLLGLDAQSGVAPDTGYMAERHFQDHLVRPDLDTLAPIPWLSRTARVLTEPSWYDGTPAAAAPRFLLRRLLDRLAERGYTLRSGFEYELYLADAVTREPVFEGIQIFWAVRNDFDPPFIMRLLEGLRATGIDIITSNAEYGPGQMEINFAPAMGVAAADQAFIFKNAVKEMALQGADGRGLEAASRRYMASFMTKPYVDQAASGCHFHHSLLARDSGANAFADATSDDGLSTVTRHWIGGQIEHARALAALVAPTVNCAKRYKLWSFAPMNATWGYEDRTVAVRVKGARGQETHLENRMPCTASNPYIVAAAILAAGLDGLERQIEPPPPTAGIAYDDEQSTKLPQRLEESLDALEADTVLRDYLGEEFMTLFLAVKRFEVDKARAALPEYGSTEWPDIVTDWERQNLFEYL